MGRWVTYAPVGLCVTLVDIAGAIGCTPAVARELYGSECGAFWTREVAFCARRAVCTVVVESIDADAAVCRAGCSSERGFMKPAWGARRVSGSSVKTNAARERCACSKLRGVPCR